MNKFFFLSFCFSLLFFSCTPYELYDTVKDIADSSKLCTDGTTYQTEFQERGIYRDEREREFLVFVDFESINDVFTTGQTAKDIAELAGIAMRALESSQDPQYELTTDVYMKGLRSFHVIVTSTQAEFDYLYGKRKDAGENTLAYTNERLFCWEDLGGVNFDIVVKNKYYNNIEVLSHEMSHIISYYEYGDSDVNHSNPDVWFPLGGFDSIQGKILWEYEAETGLNAIDGGPVAP